ncbi:MAG TPA: threonine synthase [Xanthobacteraceae bacterium]|nr:threonine synthase [Xanthobacteraceae bacterium]
MRYVSTRGEAPPVNFVDATLTGLARDGGLYVPESWPQLPAAAIASFKDKSYAEVAFEVIKPFVGGTIADADLQRILREAYAAFDDPKVAPPVPLARDEYLLELFHGPTLAFKDIAMQVLARLMDHVLGARGERATILVATSGDTGGAAVEAFRGRGCADLIVLFPAGRVSDVQRRMMTAVPAQNVHAVALEGTFDDCQAIVKALFNDHAFRDRVRLSAVNSINWARIATQMVYYYTAAAALGRSDISFVVPTGNFGDVYAGYAASRAGLALDRLVIATNVNDILARTLSTGRYEPRRVVATASPAMDIQVSSNFERLLFEVYHHDADALRALMREFAAKGSFELPDGALKAMRQTFAAGRADEAETVAAIRAVYEETGRLIDPHTAVAVAVSRKRKDKRGTSVILATAHPSKFPEVVEQATGKRPALPARLADLSARPERVTQLPADRDAVARFVREHTRAVAGAAA